MFRILFFGDVVGRAGRSALNKVVLPLRQELNPDIVIANGENSAGGLGIDEKTATEIFQAGVDVITTGNHIWHKKEIIPFLGANSNRIVRPLNFAPGAPGKGWLVWTARNGKKCAVVNLIGRVFMPDLVDCPFQQINKLLDSELKDYPIRFIDFHAEATSEKLAMSYFLDGRVTAVVGTHTHIQTADNRVLPNGTAHLTDAGMCGPLESVIGIESDAIVKRFTTGLPIKFEVAKGRAVINAVAIDCDESSGRALKIERVNREVETS